MIHNNYGTNAFERIQLTPIKMRYTCRFFSNQVYRKDAY